MLEENKKYLEMVSAKVLKVLADSMDFKLKEIIYYEVRKNVYFLEFEIKQNNLFAILRETQDEFFVRTLFYFWFFQNKPALDVFFADKFKTDLEHFIALMPKVVGNKREVIKMVFYFKSNILPLLQKKEKDIEEKLIKEADLKNRFTKIVKQKFRRGVESANVFLLGKSKILYLCRGFISEAEQKFAIEYGEIKKKYTTIHKIHEEMFLDVVKTIHEKDLKEKKQKVFLEAVCHYENNSSMVFLEV